MTHIGTIGKRITATVTLTSIGEYTDYKFSYYGTDHYIYIMKDQDGNVLVWKTTGIMSVQLESGDWYPIRKGDKIQITGTVKEHGEYRDTPQTILNRCKYQLIEKAVTKEELIAMKKAEQLASLTGDDFIWQMPYSQYKEHYSDCETLAGSFCEGNKEGRACISVIIREGRLKASGVRGKHFKGYRLEDQDGNWTTYRAVSEENALKRAQKDFPGREWKCTKIYTYNH